MGEGELHMKTCIRVCTQDGLCDCRWVSVLSGSLPVDGCSGGSRLALTQPHLPANAGGIFPSSPRSKFNFIADVVDNIAPAVVHVDMFVRYVGPSMLNSTPKPHRLLAPPASGG